MRSQFGELCRGRDVAAVYAILVVAVSTVAATQSPSLLRDIVHTSSTNLVNLRQRPLSVLFASAFVISPVAGLWIVVPMVVAYGELQRWLGRVSLFVVAVLGHVGATLFVAMMEVTELAKGRVGFIAVRPDVGVSYGLAAVAGVLVVRVPDPWRRRYVIASLIVIVGQFLILRNFTGTGAPHRLADRLGGRGSRQWCHGHSARDPELTLRTCPRASSLLRRNGTNRLRGAHRTWRTLR